MVARLLVAALLAFAASVSVAKPPAIDLVKVDKSDRMLSLMSQGSVVASFPIVLGGNPLGHKREEGDQRTPEGRYILDFKKQDSAFFRAIHISYPNQVDIRRAQKAGVNPGSAIMIHGQKNGLGWLSPLSQRFDWTDGCIALSNEHMQRVWDLVQVPIAIEIAP